MGEDGTYERRYEIGEDREDREDMSWGERGEERRGVMRLRDLQSS